MTETHAETHEDTQAETHEVPQGATTDGPAAPSPRWATLVPALLIVALLAATAVGAVALQRHDDTGTRPYAAPQVGWMQQGCAQWADSARAGGVAGAPDATWCASMAAWMNGRVAQGPMGAGAMGPGAMGPGAMGAGAMGAGPVGRGTMVPGAMGQGPMGQGQMAGATMWQSPETMQATCQQWASSSADGGSSSAWCADMVTWMTQHMGDWNGWMANGPMMAR